MTDVTIRSPRSMDDVRRMTTDLATELKSIRFNLIKANEGTPDGATVVVAHLNAKVGRTSSATRAMSETGMAIEAAADALTKAADEVRGIYDRMLSAGVPRGASW
jgi:hypothetical protein